MSFGWLLDGFNSASAGFSVLDSFEVPTSTGVSKYYSTDVLKYATDIKLFVMLGTGAADYILYDYPTLTASLDSTNGTASVACFGGTHTFFVLVLIK